MYHYSKFNHLCPYSFTSIFPLYILLFFQPHLSCLHNWCRCHLKGQVSNDEYGEEGLKGQVPPPDAGGHTFFQTGDGPTTFRFNPRNADDIFAEFFGFSSPFGGGGRGSGSNGMRGGSFGGIFEKEGPWVSKVHASHIPSKRHCLAPLRNSIRALRKKWRSLGKLLMLAGN